MGQNFLHKIQFPYLFLLLLQVFKSYPYYFTIFCLKLQVYIIEKERAFLKMPSPNLAPQRCKKFAFIMFTFFPTSTCYTSLFTIPAFRSCGFPGIAFSHPFRFCLFIFLCVNIRHFCHSFPNWGCYQLLRKTSLGYAIFYYTTLHIKLQKDRRLFCYSCIAISLSFCYDFFFWFTVFISCLNILSFISTSSYFLALSSTHFMSLLLLLV